MPDRSSSLSRPFACANCGRSIPAQGHPYQCPQCGGHFDFDKPLVYDPLDMPAEPSRGLARYRRSFPLGEAPFISLGEGGTPLSRLVVGGRSLFLKNEQLNPTGSFKDRGTSVLVSALAAEGVEKAVEDSSGNAGASFAAYASRAGWQAKVFVPDYAAGPKRRQIEAYGAEVVRVLGPRSAATEAALAEVERGSVYASHAHLPYGLAGIATLAFELYEQLGREPGALVLPVGQGTLLLGAYRGFLALRAAGRIERLPQIIGVQAMACAPLWAVFSGGASRLQWVQERETAAEGIRILRPLRGDDVLAAITASRGKMVAVEEAEILAGRDWLSRHGFFVEPTSAVVWPAFEQLADELPDPIVLVLTGSGMKDPRNGSA
jgi:threonine synthase